jgi:hypothetical protein
MESKGWLRWVDRKKPSVHGGNFSVNRWRSKGRFKGQIGDSVWNTFPSISRPLLYSLNRSITIWWWNVLFFFSIWNCSNRFAAESKTILFAKRALNLFVWFDVEMTCDTTPVSHMLTCNETIWFLHIYKIGIGTMLHDFCMCHFGYVSVCACLWTKATKCFRPYLDLLSF